MLPTSTSTLVAASMILIYKKQIDSFDDGESILTTDVYCNVLVAG